jgi:mRNA-degrading endonuclease HigB of HigAB toxin-antitoxin module
VPHGHEIPIRQNPRKTWRKIADRSLWLDIVDVRSVYPHADAVGKCTVFNVGGNDFRLVAQIAFEARWPDFPQPPSKASPSTVAR